MSGDEGSSSLPLVMLNPSVPPPPIGRRSGITMSGDENAIFQSIVISVQDECFEFKCFVWLVFQEGRLYWLYSAVYLCSFVSAFLTCALSSLVL